MKKKILTIVSALIVTACNSEPQGQMTMPIPEVSYIEVTTTPIQLEQELTGRVKAVQTAEVRPQVDGIIQDVLFVEGKPVKEGQVLYRLNPDTYRAAYDQAAAALKNAEVALDSAKITYERYQALAKVDGVSRQALDDITSTYNMAKASVDQSKAALNLAKINLERTEIKSPISGIAGISTYTRGALVNTSQQVALVTVRKVDSVYVDMVQPGAVTVSAKNRPENSRIQNGGRVVTIVSEYGEYPEKGLLISNEISVDESTGSVTLRAEFPNPNGVLMPGMFVQAKLAHAIDTQAILVPLQSVTWSARGEAYVMVLKDDNTVEYRALTLGKTYNNDWVVINGLEAGDKVVIEGLGKIRHGMTVTSVPYTGLGTNISAADINTGIGGL